MNNRLITLAKGSLKIATLGLKPTKATADFSATTTFTAETDNGEDPQGYVAVSRDVDIALLTNTKELPDNGIATFTISTGVNAGSKSGTVKIDVTGINTGARAEFELTVSASAT